MDQSRRKIIYLSGTRADFGLMRSALVETARRADLAVIITGMHLDARYGNTADDIRDAGLRICGEIPVDVSTRTPQSMSVGIADCLRGLSILLDSERPDLLVVLGDRGEMLAGAIAALHLGIVCVHIHGGERSGTVDEPVRHAISKLATYHLVATEESRDRLVRMGELQQRIRVTGAPGLDDLSRDADISPETCRQSLGLPSDRPFVLAVFHPVVQQAGDAYAQAVALLRALQQTGLPVVWSEPNADAGSGDILKALDEVALPMGSRRFSHLKRNLFCAAMKYCAVMVGNSSAGIIESASFGTPVINIGDRQRLRERNTNVQDVPVDAAAIAAAIDNALTHGKWPCDNRYGDGLSAPRIAGHLVGLSLERSVLEKINSY